MTALIVDFPAPKQPMNFESALDRIEQATEWLERNGVVVRGFGYNGHGPPVAVEGSAQVRRLLGTLAGPYRRRTHHHQVFEADTPSGVRIVWEEVTCRH